jgi:alanyl-tRNA synthetase
MGADETVYHTLPSGLITEFVGYETLTCDAEILAVVQDGEDTALVLSRSPFYAAGGGQKGDAGVVYSNTARLIVHDCLTVAGSNIVVKGKPQAGKFAAGECVTAEVDTATRADTARNHTATHLLQAALRRVLGDHVEQAGSSVGADGLRFDFTHMQGLSRQQREEVEALVNEAIQAATIVSVQLCTPEEARAAGAIALFGEKYGDTVRMVSAGGSVELCGGTHVGNTQEIGVFRLVSEGGIASGVRRIEGVTGRAALAQYREDSRLLAEAAAAAKVKPAELPAKIVSLQLEIKDAKRAAKQAAPSLSHADIQAEAIGDFKVICTKIDADAATMRDLCDKLKGGMKSGVVFLCAVSADAVQFMCSATDDAVAAGIHCGNIVKAAAATCGGGGGGRPNHAQAGGKDAAKADAAVSQAREEVGKALQR